MKIWTSISHALKGKSMKKTDNGAFLYCMPSRPFHLVTDVDNGQRPCIKVNGISIAEASEKFLSKSIKWESIKYEMMESLTTGEKFIEIDAADLHIEIKHANDKRKIRG